MPEVISERAATNSGSLLHSMSSADSGDDSLPSRSRSLGSMRNSRLANKGTRFPGEKPLASKAISSLRQNSALAMSVGGLGSYSQSPTSPELRARRQRALNTSAVAGSEAPSRLLCSVPSDGDRMA